MESKHQITGLEDAKEEKNNIHDEKSQKTNKSFELCCLTPEHWNSFFIMKTNNYLQLPTNIQIHKMRRLNLQSFKIGFINIYDDESKKLFRKLNKIKFIINQKHLTIFKTFAKIIEIFYDLPVMTLNPKKKIHAAHLDNICYYAREYTDGFSFISEGNQRDYDKEYATNDILKRLRNIKKLKCYSKNLFILVGICLQELYSEHLNELYGIAKTRQGLAAVSMVPMDTKKINKLLFFKRSLKVLIHEIGHLFHLNHCRDFLCVMNGSDCDEDAQDIKEIDKEPIHLCPVCLQKLYFVRGKYKMKDINLLERYDKLYKVCDQIGLKDEAMWYKSRVDFIQKNIE
eukprot:131329_1